MRIQAALVRFNELASVGIYRILKKKNRKNQASLLYFKNLNKVHHETAHDRRHVRDPYSFTDRNDSSSFNYENFIKEYHVYIKVWSPLLGECLFGKKEQSNGVEKNAVAVIHLNSSGKKGVVSYVPQNISGVVSLYFSRPHYYLELEFTGKRVDSVGGDRLKITAKFRFYGPENAT